MRVLKTGYILQMVIVVAIIMIVGGYELPKYASRLTLLAILSVIDMRYWFSVRKYFTPRYKKVLTVAYWLPLYMLLLLLISGILTPFIEWNSFIRIYFPGVLFILLVGKGIFITLIVFGDIFIIPLNVIRHINPENIARLGRWYRPRIFLLASAGIAYIVMAVFVSGMFFWVRDFKVTSVEIPVQNLPEEFDGYKVIQISDLHLGGFVNDRPVKEIVRIVNEQQPDAVMFTGDLVSFTTDEVYPFEAALKQMSAKDGIFAILGNHDYGEYTRWNSQEDKDLNDKELLRFYDRIGWHMLRNQNSFIKRDSVSIAVIGVENWSKTKRFAKKGDLKKAISGTESTQFKILLSHDPSHWDGEVNTLYPQIDLTLSGHTHAFQLAIESSSVKWSPASMFFKEWGGLYEKDHEDGTKQYLYVNRGAGTLGYPGRIFTRPEITLIVLRKAS
jgi:predicted MPP superfamily phosphohydrolase